jgi:hypothetical protein
MHREPCTSADGMGPQGVKKGTGQRKVEVRAARTSCHPEAVEAIRLPELELMPPSAGV